MQKVLRRRDSLHRAAYLGVLVAIHRNPPSRLASALDGYYPLAPIATLTLAVAELSR